MFDSYQCRHRPTASFSSVLTGLHCIYMHCCRNCISATKHGAKSRACGVFGAGDWLHRNMYNWWVSSPWPVIGNHQPDYISILFGDICSISLLGGTPDQRGSSNLISVWQWYMRYAICIKYLWLSLEHRYGRRISSVFIWNWNHAFRQI